jgi:hypothetical protein
MDSVQILNRLNLSTEKYKYTMLQAIRHSYWLHVGRPRGQSTSSGRVQNFHFPILSRPSLGHTQPPIQCVPWAPSTDVKLQGLEASTEFNHENIDLGAETCCETD